jgi:hypothetical protein
VSATQIALAASGVLAIFALIAIKIVGKSHHSPVVFLAGRSHRPLRFSPVRLWKDFRPGAHDAA